MNLKKIGKAVVLSLLLFGCIDKNPENIAPREKKCEHCKMDIAQMNYHSQLISPKGRKFHFDSIECMVSYWVEDESKAEKLFVKDFHSPNEWMNINEAFFLKSEKLPSPMSANISSYKNVDIANKAREEFGGKILNLSELKQYIRIDWKKELSEKSKH